MKLTNKILEAVNRGIKFALDDFEDNEQIQGQVNSKIKHNYGTKEWLDLMEEAVDLDLPSGTLWCKYNLDVNPNQLTKPEDWYGGYYAWGELEPNKKFNKDGVIYFDWGNYKFGNGYGNLTKYCNNPKYGLNRSFFDNLTELLPEDDAAYQCKKCHNFKFHIPTKEQCEELIKYTKNYWVENYNPNKIKHNLKNDKGIQGLNGRVFEGRNGNQLFIPAAGYRYDSKVYSTYSSCRLWSSSLDLDDPVYVYYLYIINSDIDIGDFHRCYGFTIRPIINL